MYDGKMRRRKRVECTWNGSGWTTNQIVCYVYDGNLVVSERELNPQLSTLIPQPTITYTRGKDLSGSLEGAGGIGGLLARSTLNAQPSTHAYYHADGNGNITALINTNQTFAATYLYDPFGNILAQSGTLADANLYRFSSKEYHPNSGLVYYLYRAYDPSLQRWLSRDPIAEKGGLNLYGFVHNNPISKYDPDGRWIVPVGGGIIVAGGGAYVGLCINRWACRRHRDLTLGLDEAQANANAPDGSTHRGAGATPGNDADMLTHCITSCDLARHPGPCGSPDRALDFMQERETGNDAATQIDRLNNEVGFGVGISSQWQGQTCTAACLDALNRGLLYTVRNGAPAPSPLRR